MSHPIGPDGYCPKCQGGCMLPLAEANAEAMRQAAFARPSPFVLMPGGPATWTCSCGLTRPMTGSYGCADCGDPRPEVAS